MTREFLPMQRYASMVYAVAVCLSQGGVQSKRPNGSICFSAQRLPLAYPIVC